MSELERLRQETAALMILSAFRHLLNNTCEILACEEMDAPLQVAKQFQDRLARVLGESTEVEEIIRQGRE